MAETFIGGCGPKLSQSVATIAAPVGVTSSFCTPFEYVGLPCSKSAVAGAGTGKTPCANFVKMNLLKGHVVNAGFGFAQFFEDSGSALAHLRSEPRFFEDFEDRTEGAMLGLILCFDFDVGGGHAVLPDFFGGEIPARDL